jgi:hypothetical protein
VTDFPHVKQMFTDAYARLVAMKLFSLRAADYMRAASPADRRYLLYNPIVKMKVTTQGEEVINLLWDVIAAKGFERDTYFEMAARDIRALPKLEGTVHVNIALIVKFMPNYFFNPAEYPEITRQAKWRNFYQASGGKLFVVCDNRSCMRNIRSEINYCLGNRPLVVSLTNLADLQAGKRGDSDRIWLEVKQKGLE